jgi:DedD protein
MSRQPLDVVYRDKIEVSLDGRQIFYLFFGGAVIVGLVFVLGVMVGRRVEARGHVDRARTTAAQDPLAALDRLESNGGMSFRGALMGAAQDRNSDVERQIREIEKARKPEGPAAAVAPPVKPEIKPEIKPEPPKAAVVEQKPVTKPEQVKSDDKPAKKPEVAKLDDKKPEPKVEAKADKKPEAKAEDKKLESKPEPKAEAKAEAKADKKPEPKSDEKKPESEEKKSKYVLQLSSFQERAEAEAFLAQIKGAGYAPFITEGTVNGTKFYRVRMGSYKSMDAANEAKSEVEKSLKKSATVMKL